MKPLRNEDYEALAGFRYGMRKFLRFSKDELRRHGQLTPEQYEAMLALRAFGTARGLTVGQLSERLQVKHHTAVTLVNKLVERGAASRTQGTSDRREVYVKLTPQGTNVLETTASVHRREIRDRSAELIAALERLQK
ncbi:MAG: MarR family winged helix-turn-helix transcriptional regulator [Chthoniobacterales bacterium]|jgi:DNA-binding MarR family transcriptional regulator